MEIYEKIIFMEILNASKNKFNCLVGKDINIIRCEDLISKENLFEPLVYQILAFW